MAYCSHHWALDQRGEIAQATRTPDDDFLGLLLGERVVHAYVDYRLGVVGLLLFGVDGWSDDVLGEAHWVRATSIALLQFEGAE